MWFEGAGCVVAEVWFGLLWINEVVRNHDPVPFLAMSSRQLLPRLLQRASRLVTANTTSHIAHRNLIPARASLPHQYEPPTFVSVLGSRTLSTCSLFPSSARVLVPGSRNGLQLATREVGFTPADHTYAQQRRTLTKLKKTKIKAYSSYKKRFRGMANGEYKRWRSGKQHNAHSKTNKQKRQLRRPSIAPLALAKVMKKLNFMGWKNFWFAVVGLFSAIRGCWKTDTLLALLSGEFTLLLVPAF